MGSFILELKQIEKTFGIVKALYKTNFQLKLGEVHAILGSNGAGKSTLMKIISGAYVHDSGEILFDGKVVTLGNPNTASNLGISIVYQEFSLIPDLTVAENIYLGKFPMKRSILPSIDQKMMKQMADEVLAEIGISIDTLRAVRSLSVGEQQIVEIAKVISNRSKVIILDEPTSALTLQEIEHLFQIIRTLKEKGVSIIYITHRLEELELICDRVTVMRDGRNIETFNIGETSIVEMVDLMLGEAKILHQIKNVGSKRLEPILQLQQLTNKKLKEVTLTVNQSEIIGLAGQMGSGRTEVLKSIFGLDEIWSGQITYSGQVVTNHSLASMIQRGVGYVSENRKEEGILKGRSIRENIVITIIKQISKFAYISPKREMETANKAILSTGLLPALPEREIDTLSGGNQQKAILGRWLSMDNLKLLLLDEPTRGIDVGAKAQIYEMLFQISQKGISIIVASSDAEELVQICDRIVVMKQGKSAQVLQNDDKLSVNTLMKIVVGGND